MLFSKSTLRLLVSAVAFSFVGSPIALLSQQPPEQSQAPPPEQPENSQLDQQQLEQLLAPIALYPDALVAQILAASAYPTEIVEAERFLEQNPNLKGKDLGDQVNQQDWDPSVKALTQYPSVLENMNKDLSWTSELGDANYNQPQDVMNAIQDLRAKAQQAGTLKNTPQQSVSDQNGDIQIAPANPDVVYVPEYNPDLVYGYPIGLWPGFYPWWGINTPYISFGIGFGLGPFMGYGWGWHNWGFDWHRRALFYGGAPYAFHSHAFYDRNAYFHGNYRGGAPFARGDRGLRGYRAPPGRAEAPSYRFGGRSGAFGGANRGGYSRSFSARGRSSFGAPHGGAAHGGGGHGGHGGHGGGRR